jgi:hypothetical protein
VVSSMHPYWLNISRALLRLARGLWHPYWLKKVTCFSRINMSRALVGLARGLWHPYWLNMSRALLGLARGLWRSEPLPPVL